MQQQNPQQHSLIQNQPLQNSQNFPQNHPQNQPQNQQFQNFNFNQNMFMMQPMTPEQQRIQLEFLKKEAFQKGQILKKQKETMELILKNRAKREQERKTEEMVLFFNYNHDTLPITVKADQLIPEVLQQYIEQSGNQNVKFFFKGKELKLDDTSGTTLYEIERLRTGEEIIVKDIN